MIYAPLTPALLVFFALVLGLFLVLVEVRILAFAYRKIGVRPRYVFAVLVLSLVGSHVNVPLFSVSVEHVLPPQMVEMFGRTYVVPEVVVPRTTVVALNLGGALIPALVSAYLFFRTRLYWRMLLGIVIVTLVVYRLAEIVPGVGIAVPMLVPPLVAAGAALVLSVRSAPPVAYVSGSMGALIGADLLNLGRIADLQAPVAAIGGAGTFDGVFLTGIIAGLLV